MIRRVKDDAKRGVCRFVDRYVEVVCWEHCVLWRTSGGRLDDTEAAATTLADEWCCAGTKGMFEHS